MIVLFSFMFFGIVGCRSILESIFVIDTVILEVGSNVGSHVKERIVRHITAINSVQIFVVDNLRLEFEKHCSRISNETQCIATILHSLNASLLYANYYRRTNPLFLSIGNASISSMFINSTSLRKLPKESFHIETFCINASVLPTFKPSPGECKSLFMVSNGLPLETHSSNISFNPDSIHYGAVVGAFAVLELLGFSFLHPLEPYRPSRLRLSMPLNGHIRMIESPHWPHRAFHIHTQHPLELTEVLQGHDIPQFGPHGPHCKRFSRGEPTGDLPYCERWEDMVEDVSRLFEWAVANRCNRLEWLLLANYKWGDELDTRQQRLLTLTQLGHSYSLLIGADSPIVNIQQHGWSMVNTRHTRSQQRKQLRDRVDWIFRSGFDFLTTESGLSEFSHPECDLMLELMNEFAMHVNLTWGREAGIKVHCSTGQVCDGHLDPRSDEPINFNFLPTFAHPAMGVFPHTVQVYGLDDPVAGAYGNDNFSAIEDYLVFEAKKGNRSVVYYGETAYWVNVDVDVPLFLPLYGQRRQHDLRRLAAREVREDFRMQGQMNFDSGWEWGYWMSDVVTARAAWNPMLDERKLQNDSYQVRDDMWETFRESLRPFTKIFGRIYGPLVADLLVDLTVAEERLLVQGSVRSTLSEGTTVDLNKLSGMAYMSGADTWVEVPRLFGVAFTQPDKLHIRERDDPLWPLALELLREMEEVFAELHARMKGLQRDMASDQGRCYQQNSSSLPSDVAECWSLGEEEEEEVSPAALLLLDEVGDGMEMLALRAGQLVALYSSRDRGVLPSQTSELQQQSREIIKQAQGVVARREQHYRVPWQRVAMWRENPTVYRYGYLWAVHSLYYWWRDQGLAEEAASMVGEQSPCYLNRMDISEVAVGWGRYTLELLRALLGLLGRYLGPSRNLPLDIVNCFSPPTREYQFPKDLYHLD